MLVVAGNFDLSNSQPELRFGGNSASRRYLPRTSNEHRHCHTARRLMIVEDDALIAMDLELVLRDSGHDVISVSRVEEALEVLRIYGKELDGALLDVQLHEKTCHPIAKLLAEHGIPHVFATAHDTETTHKLGLVGRVIQKPFSHAHLISWVTDLPKRIGRA